MATAKDILTDDDGDLLIRNGDIVIGESDNQHVYDIINSNPGDWKEFPLCGIGIDNYLNSSGKQQELYALAQKQLSVDGYQVEDVVIERDTDGNLSITPYVTRN